MEDAADILTLKDNTDSVEDYATALHLLARAQVKLFFVSSEVFLMILGRISLRLGKKPPSARFGGAYISTMSMSIYL